MSTSRNFCFTTFTKPDENLFSNNEKIRYAVYQEELCPSSNKSHWQGYIELNKGHRPAGVKKLLNDNTMHLEPRRGTRDQARNYCMKEESRKTDPKEFGEWISGQGARTDISSAVSMIRENKPMLEILNEYPDTFVKYNRGLNAAAALINKNNSNQFRELNVEIRWGESGCGKTRYAYDTYGFNNVFKLDHNGNSIWWDGYEHQDVLLIDDFYGWIPWGMFLNILDGYPLRLPIKGGHAWAVYTKVIITSNKPPHLWYLKGVPEELYRRVTKCYNVTKSGVILDPDFVTRAPSRLECFL